MTVQAEPRDTGGKTLKKPAGKAPEKGRDALSKISEYSLRDFLDDEPDLYSVRDIKVRYQ